MSKAKDPCEIMVFGRAAFLRVDKPERFQGTGEPRYSGSVILEVGEQGGSPADIAAVKAAMRAAAAKQWGEDKADAAVNGLMKAMKTAFIDGDTKPDVLGYPGNMIIQAHARVNQPPSLVATKGGVNILLDRETQATIYGGCYVNAKIQFWAQDNKWGKRINAQLCGLQFVKDGLPFSGGKPADVTDFDTVETADGVDAGDWGTPSDDDVAF